MCELENLHISANASIENTAWDWSTRNVAQSETMNSKHSINQEAQSCRRNFWGAFVKDGPSFFTTSYPIVFQFNYGNFNNGRCSPEFLNNNGLPMLSTGYCLV